MVFWSDTTDRKSPVPSEAINISHLPRQSGQGRGRCQQGDCAVTRPEPAKATRGRPFCRLREQGAGLARRTALWGVRGVGVEGSFHRTKNLQLQVLVGALPLCSPAPGSRLCHALPPSREREREAWRTGKGGKQVQNTWAQSIHPHCPPGPRSGGELVTS